MATPLEQWVDEVARHTHPKDIYWCDGSEAENQRLVREMLASGTLHELNQTRYPNCHLHRSDPSDVARTEHLTFICSRAQDDAGPTNNWMDPRQAKEKVGALFRGAMQGRTMYVVPYVMGPIGSPFSKVGVELTDSPYVVASMRIMTRMGAAAMKQLGARDDFVKGLHSLGDLSPERRFILHFPEEKLIWSVGSGYGGNAPLGKNSIFTNVAVTEDGCPWWEGIHGPVPERLTDWRGRPWQKGSSEKAAHPNSRFTAPAAQCPSISPRFDDPQGVPISALVFGGRRARTAPLVLQAFDWSHGVFVGASVASETTAAQSGAVGVVRRDPMAKLPFCGYNMADYFGHWLEMGKAVERPPAIFHVNWFRQDAEGKFIWPGFGENMRVLRWIVARAKGAGAAAESPIGMLPAKGAIDTSGLAVDARTMEELLSVSKDDWRREAAGIGEFFGKFDGRLPAEMERQRQGLVKRLG